MKSMIRRGTFETNSSSTHSLTLFTGEEYDKFKEGKIWIQDGYYSGRPRFIEPFTTESEVYEFVEDQSKYDFPKLKDKFEEIRKVYDNPVAQMKHLKEYMNDTGRYQDMFISLDDWDAYTEQRRYEGYAADSDINIVEVNDEKFVIVCHYGYDG